MVEKNYWNFSKKGNSMGHFHTCIGQELIGVCLAENLKHEDHLISNHRGHVQTPSPLRSQTPRQSRARPRPQGALSSPPGRATRLCLDTGHRRTFIRAFRQPPVSATFPPNANSEQLGFDLALILITKSRRVKKPPPKSLGTSNHH